MTKMPYGGQENVALLLNAQCCARISGSRTRNCGAFGKTDFVAGDAER